jgi:FkbM family methyltransferase
MGYTNQMRWFFLMKSLSKNDFFLDVGANIGSYALPISAVTKCRSIAIEAIPSTYEVLVGNIKRNKLENLVLPLNIGASAQEGKLTFTADLNVSNRVVKGNRSSIDSIEVKTNSLDNLVTNPIKAMKIDVEGFETEVIEGAKKLLDSSDLEILIVEINGHGMKNFGFDEDLLLQKIQTQGFTPVHYDLDKNHLTATSGRNLHGNTIFVKNIAHSNEILKTHILNSHHEKSLLLHYFNWL